MKALGIQRWREVSWIYGENRTKNSFTSLLRQLFKEHTGEVTIFQETSEQPYWYNGDFLLRKIGVGVVRICAEYLKMVGESDRILIWVHFQLEAFSAKEFYTLDWSRLEIDFPQRWFSFYPHEVLPLIALIILLKKKICYVFFFKGCGKPFFSYIVFSWEKLSTPPTSGFLAINVISRVWDLIHSTVKHWGSLCCLILNLLDSKWLTTPFLSGVKRKNVDHQVKCSSDWMNNCIKGH